MQQQLPRIKQVMPVGPSACPDRLIRFIPRLNLTTWYIPLLLPPGKALFQNGDDLFFTLEVVFIGCTKMTYRFLLFLFIKICLNPANTIETFLKNIP